MMQVLDRDRPLWELWFVEGVDHGEHVGLVHKSHHTLTDGISGVDIATVLLDFSAEPTVLAARRVGGRRPRPIPTRLMLDSVRERLTRPSELVGTARHAGRRPAGGAGARRRPRALDRLARRRPGRGAAAVAQRAGRARSPLRDRAHLRSTT